MKVILLLGVMIAMSLSAESAVSKKPFGKMPDGTISDRIPTKVTLAIKPKTNHENACP